MPVLRDTANATWNDSDAAKFFGNVEKMRKLLCFPNVHFTANELLILKAMSEKLGAIADEFEEDLDHHPLVGYEVNGLSGLRASMGVGGNGEVNRSRLWDGTAYLTELNSDDY